MKSLTHLGAFAICLLLTAFVYFLSELAISNGYSTMMTYAAAGIWVVCSWLVLSVLIFEPEYFMVALWGLACLGWVAICRVLESPNSDSLAGIMFDDNRAYRYAIEGGLGAVLIVGAFLYVQRKPSVMPGC